MNASVPFPVEAAEAFHRWFYDSEQWKRTTFLGVPVQKSVLDLWNYQEILFERKPAFVVEFGSYLGGSAVWFAETLNLIRPGAPVVSVDVRHDRLHPDAARHPRVRWVTASSTAPEVREALLALRRERPGPVFAVLDSDHAKAHVLGEMTSLRDVLVPGDYLVVEDGNVNGHPVLPGWGEGPWEAIEEYVRRFPDDYEHDVARETKFGITFAPRGYLIRR